MDSDSKYSLRTIANLKSKCLRDKTAQDGYWEKVLTESAEKGELVFSRSKQLAGICREDSNNEAIWVHARNADEAAEYFDNSGNESFGIVVLSGKNEDSVQCRYNYLGSETGDIVIETLDKGRGHLPSREIARAKSFDELWAKIKDLGYSRD